MTIEQMLDYIREESETETLNAAGLIEEEDIFASVWNQTITLIVRGIATGQVQLAHGERLLRKEAGVALFAKNVTSGYISPVLRPGSDVC